MFSRVMCLLVFGPCLVLAADQMTAAIKLNAPGINVPALGREDLGSLVCDEKGTCRVCFLASSPELNRMVVYFATLQPDGRAEKSRPLSDRPSIGPRLLAGKNGVLHLTWLEKTKGQYRLGHRRSTDGGTDWSAPAFLTDEISSRPPMFQQDAAGNLYVLYTVRRPAGTPTEMRLQASRDGGESWQQVSVPGLATRPALEARLVGGSLGVALIWIESRKTGMNLMFTGSKDGGLTWLAEPVAVERDSSLPLEDATLLEAGNRYLLIWRQRTIEAESLSYSMSRDGGVEWSTAAKFFAAPVTQLTYEIQVLGNNCMLTTCGLSGTGREQSHHVTQRRFSLDQLTGQGEREVTAVTTWNHKSYFPPDFISLVTGDRFWTAAVVRKPSQIWSLFLFSSEGSSDRNSTVQIAPDEGGRDRSLVATVGLPGDEVVVVYREQRARGVPDEVQPGDLLFRRVRLSKVILPN